MTKKIGHETGSYTVYPRARRLIIGQQAFDRVHEEGRIGEEKKVRERKKKIDVCLDLLFSRIPSTSRQTPLQPFRPHKSFIHV